MKYILLLDYLDLQEKSNLALRALLSVLSIPAKNALSVQNYLLFSDNNSAPDSPHMLLSAHSLKRTVQAQVQSLAFLHG